MGAALPRTPIVGSGAVAGAQSDNRLSGASDRRQSPGYSVAATIAPGGSPLPPALPLNAALDVRRARRTRSRQKAQPRARASAPRGSEELDRRRVQRPQPDLAPGHALLDQRRGAEDDGGGDLDGLQDDPVGEGVRVADAVGAVEDEDARGLEDADVRRGERQDRRDVDREQHRGRRAEVGGAGSSPSATIST